MVAAVRKYDDVAAGTELSITDAKKAIEEAYSMEMPNDLYQLWECCQDLSPKNPSGQTSLYGSSQLSSLLNSVDFFLRFARYDLHVGNHLSA